VFAAEDDAAAEATGGSVRMVGQKKSSSNMVGLAEGAAVGTPVGAAVGVVGVVVGMGEIVGWGEMVGDAEGAVEGAGEAVGLALGDPVGLGVTKRSQSFDVESTQVGAND